MTDGWDERGFATGLDLLDGDGDWSIERIHGTGGGGYNSVVGRLRSESRSAIVKVNDRGPFIAGRIIDLSYAAAKKLGVDGPGTANVEIRVIDDAQGQPTSVARSTARRFWKSWQRSAEISQNSRNKVRPLLFRNKLAISGALFAQ